MDVSVKMRVSHVTLLFPCSMPLYYGERRPRLSLYEYFANNPWTGSKSAVVSMCKAEAKCFKLFVRWRQRKPGTLAPNQERLKHMLPVRTVKIRF